MSDPQTPDPDAQLPAWHAERLALLLDALGGPPVTPLSTGERDALTWLAGFERHTAEHLAGLLGRMTRRSTHLANQLTKARRAAVSRHNEADRYRHQLADLCDWAGVEAGEDPHAALVAHLQRTHLSGGRP